MQTVALRNMKKNQSGVIKAIKVNGELGRRLREMGLTPGTKISVCGRAPLKDPVAIRVLNSILTLRNNEAEYIHVEIKTIDQNEIVNFGLMLKQRISTVDTR